VTDAGDLGDELELADDDGSMSVVEVIPAALGGERVDRVVALVTGLSRADAAELVRSGEVLVGGTPATGKSLRLAEGDELAVRWVPAAAAAAIEPDPSVIVPVVHADDDVIVVDKPAGLVVHPGAGNQYGTLVHGLVARFPEILEVGAPDRPGVVHRIDKETSGLLVVARSPRAYESLVEQLSARTVHRRYDALVWGAFEVGHGRIEAPIGRSNREPTRMTVSERGRPAITHYEVVEPYTEPVEVTRVSCRLETGRTHQIRVHMLAIDHPVVGDRRYRGDRQSFPVPRLFLHAAELGFEHPATGEHVRFASPLPADLDGVLGQLS
jgi:23S rRNA pseudouridine1911/1915/1917 synthase